MYPLNLHCKVFFTEITRVQKCSYPPCWHICKGILTRIRCLSKDPQNGVNLQVNCFLSTISFNLKLVYAALI